LGLRLFEDVAAVSVIKDRGDGGEHREHCVKDDEFDESAQKNGLMELCAVHKKGIIGP